MATVTSSQCLVGNPIVPQLGFLDPLLQICCNCFAFVKFEFFKYGFAKSSDFAAKYLNL